MIVANHYFLSSMHSTGPPENIISRKSHILIIINKQKAYHAECPITKIPHHVPTGKHRKLSGGGGRRPPSEGGVRKAFPGMVSTQLGRGERPYHPRGKNFLLKDLRGRSGLCGEAATKCY